MPSESLRRRLDKSQRVQRPKVRLVSDQRLTSILVRSHRSYLEVRMVGEYSKQLAPCVAARAGNCDRKRHTPNLVRCRTGLFSDGRAEELARPSGPCQLGLGRFGSGQCSVCRPEAQSERQRLEPVTDAGAAIVVDQSRVLQ
jgi:hypothetical protein